MATKKSKSKKQEPVVIEAWVAVEFEGLSPTYEKLVPEMEGEFVTDEDGEEIWEETLDEDGNPIPVLDENGEQAMELQVFDRPNIANGIEVTLGARDDKKAEAQARRDMSGHDPYGTSYLLHIVMEAPAGTEDLTGFISDFVTEAAREEEEWDDYEYATLFPERDLDEDDEDYTGYEDFVVEARYAD